MRLRITTVTVIDLGSGEASSKSSWRVEGPETGLGSALSQAAAAVLRLTPPAPASPALASDSLESIDNPDPTLKPDRARPEARESLVLAGLLDLRADVEKALDERPAGRVLEVLKWIRKRRSSTTIRDMSSLFWSVVSRD